MNLDVDCSPDPPGSDRDQGCDLGRGRDRDPGRDRDVYRRGHRREFDARQPHRSLSDRVDGVVCDVGTFRVVAQTDLVSRQFDGHPFAARQGIAQAEQRGWIVRQPAPGPTGRPYTVIVATPAGAARAAVLWARAGRADQRVFSGAVKAADVGHEVAVYRAAGAAQARIEAAGGRVARIRIDAELKGQIAARTERARQVAGRAAAVAAQRRAAAELHLPVEHGKVLFPDAQIEYVNVEGLAGRCNVEVASEHYGCGAIRAKAAAGFQMYAAAGQAADVVRRALAGGGAGGGRKRGGRAGWEYEVFEL